MIAISSSARARMVFRRMGPGYFSVEANRSPMRLRSRRRALRVTRLVGLALVFVVALPAGVPLAQEEKPPECGEPKIGHAYTSQTMKVTFRFDVSGCELVPRRFQGPYLVTQPDFIVVAVLIHDDMLQATAIPASSPCWRDRGTCKVTLRMEHFPIERATYSASATLLSLKSPFARVAAFYGRCTSAYMLSTCGI